MKKLSMLLMLAAVVFGGGVAFADPSVGVSVEAVSRFYDEADNGIGAAAQVEVPGLFPGTDLVLLTGLEKIGTEANSSEVSNFVGRAGFFNVTGTNSAPAGVDLDLTTWSVGLGYDFDINEAWSVRPYGTMDFAFIRADGNFEADNSVGFSAGVEGAYQFNNSVFAFVGVGHQWLETDLASNGSEANVILDNFNLKAGISYQF